MARPDPPALERAALDYLGRYASSAENLRRVLLRRLARAGGVAPAEAKRDIDAIVARYLAAGLLDDAAYAAHQAARLRRRG
ncbi:MAG: regulatory protein RecX, partial [Stellaceae bacterium]